MLITILAFNGFNEMNAENDAPDKSFDENVYNNNGGFLSDEDSSNKKA